MSAAAAAAAPMAQSWSEAIAAAVRVVATTALQLPVELVPPTPLGDAPALAAYIPVIARDESLQVGVVAESGACAVLARALLQMEPDEPIAGPDVADAMGEIANMIVGMAKATMSAQLGLVALGLPMVVHGWVEPPHGVQHEYVGARVGDSPITVVIHRAPRTA